MHHGTAQAIREQRQATLDAAYAANPQRFARRPAPPALPTAVWINPPEPTVDASAPKETAAQNT